MPRWIAGPEPKLVVARPGELPFELEAEADGGGRVVERRQQALADRLDHGAACVADRLVEQAEQLVDHVEGPRITQFVVEGVGLRGVELDGHQGDGGDRRELAGRENLAREKLSEQCQRRGSGRGQGVGSDGGSLDSDQQLVLQRVREGEDLVAGPQVRGRRRRDRKPGRSPRAGRSAAGWTWKSTDQGSCGPRIRYDPSVSSSASSIRSPAATRTWATTCGECAGPPMQ